jgi:hypothetical protein
MRVKMNQMIAMASATPRIVPTMRPAPTPLSGALWLFWARIVTASVVMGMRFPLRRGAMHGIDSRRDGAGTGQPMQSENREDLPPDDGAVEESGTGEHGGAGVPGGAGEGTPGGPEAYPHPPGEGPTADEETGITGDPDER